MQSYFANFIKTGNPNGEGLAQWSSMGGNISNPPYLIIDVTSKEEKSNVEARYQFHDRYYSKKD